MTSIRPTPVFSCHANHETARLVVIVVLTVWFALIYFLGAKGLFVRQVGQPPFPISVGATSPLLVFAAACWLSPSFRALLQAQRDSTPMHRHSEA